MKNVVKLIQATSWLLVAAAVLLAVIRTFVSA